MKATKLYAAILESIILGLLAAIYMAGAALDHNPQQKFYDSIHGIVVENLLPMMTPWFAAVAGLWLILRVALNYYAAIGR